MNNNNYIFVRYFAKSEQFLVPFISLSLLSTPYMSHLIGTEYRSHEIQQRREYD